ncbi:MAG: DUF190 domain-containing protein, partial [Actinomycetota bacterium]|nr:DUF190 domain-containing protein [Actinomycetota bacterium]
MPPTLSIVLKARNEEAMIPGWLRRLDFADEIVAAVDDRSDDRTAELLVSAGVKVTTVRFEGFDALVNAAIDLATGDWVFLLDADERVSRLLAAEIRTAVDGPFDGLRVPTANYFHAQLMRFGGWQEHPVKLWRRGTARLAGTIHERACFLIENPRIGELQTPLAHLKIEGRARLMQIYLGESDRWRDKPLYIALVEAMRANDIAGVTVYRGILGYGA